MVKISEAFPSKYLKSEDIGDRTVECVIDHAAIEEVGVDREKKLVLYFRGKKQGVVMNKTNSNTLAAAYGDDTDTWGGKAVELYVENTTFGGQPRLGIRMRVPVAPAEDIPF